jgi:hypothetical protein
MTAAAAIATIGATFGVEFISVKMCRSLTPFTTSAADLYVIYKIVIGQVKSIKN